MNYSSVISPDLRIKAKSHTIIKGYIADIVYNRGGFERMDINIENTISKELEAFRKFKKNYIFNPKNIEEINGKLYCDNMTLLDDEGKEIGICDNWINVGYKIKGPFSKVLSNLFPYEFVFRGQKLNSIETFFQGIKFKDKNIQKYVFKYSGLDSNNIKVASDYDWKTTGEIYWQGEPINRNGEEYYDIIDELYISAIQNPLYRQVLKNCDKYILHSIGEIKTENTVFARCEFEFQLNCLKDFLRSE